MEENSSDIQIEKANYIIKFRQLKTLSALLLWTPVILGQTLYRYKCLICSGGNTCMNLFFFLSNQAILIWNFGLFHYSKKSKHVSETINKVMCQKMDLLKKKHTLTSFNEVWRQFCLLSAHIQISHSYAFTSSKTSFIIQVLHKNIWQWVEPKRSPKTLADLYYCCHAIDGTVLRCLSKLLTPTLLRPLSASGCNINHFAINHEYSSLWFSTQGWWRSEVELKRQGLLRNN